MQAVIKDLFEMQEQAFSMKEEFQDMLYLEFSNQIHYFFKLCSVTTDSEALINFGMSMREFRPFRRHLLRIFESVRQTFNIYMRHIAKQRKTRQFFTKVDRCAKKLLILRRTTTRKTRLRNLQSLRDFQNIL